MPIGRSVLRWLHLTVTALMLAATAPATATTIFAPAASPPNAFEDGFSPGTGISRLATGGVTSILTWRAEPPSGELTHIEAARSTDATTWTAVPLPEVPFSSLPDVATDGNGTWVVVCSTRLNVPGPANADVFLSRSTDDGLTWSPAGVIEPGQVGDVDNDTYAAVAADGAGNWVAVWQRAGTIVASRSTDDAATWSAPVDVGGGGTPRIATDHAGTWVTIWEGGNVNVSRSTDGGATWSTPLAIGQANGTTGDNPEIAANAGTFLATWYTDGLHAARSTDGGITWPAAPTPAPNGGRARPAAGGPGEWIFVWRGLEPYDGLLPNVTIFAAWSSDDAASWSTPTPVDTAALVREAGWAQPVARDDGQWLVAWETFAARSIDAPTACAPMPLPGCNAATAKGAKLGVRDRTPDTGDQLQFSWSRGGTTSFADFGIPIIITDERLCVYDGTGLAAGATAPAGGTCAGKPCWKRSGATRLGYLDREQTPDGLDKVSLQASRVPSTKAKLTMGGKGAAAMLPALPLVLPVVVQIQAAHGTCWTATISNPSRNDATQFVGSSD